MPKNQQQKETKASTVHLPLSQALTVKFKQPKKYIRCDASASTLWKTRKYTIYICTKSMRFTTSIITASTLQIISTRAARRAATPCTNAIKQTPAICKSALTS